MKREDFIGAPCSCGECVQAGVSHEEIRRDPDSGRWMHGYSLKRFYENYARFKREARAAVGPKGRHQGGFERIATKWPGDEQ